MDLGHIDITAPHFWLVVLAAAFLLAPLKQQSVRRVLFAGLNIGFLWALLDVWVVAVILGVLVVALALEAIARNESAWATFIGGMSVSTLMFVLHKRPDIVEACGNVSLNPLLGAIGFSYVFLRLLELFRAVW